MSATPSTPIPSDAAGRDWSAHESGPRRSIFGNYRGSAATDAPAAPATLVPGSRTSDVAIARSFIYRHLALAFEYPSRESWKHLSGSEQARALKFATAEMEDPRIAEATDDVRDHLQSATWETYHDVYVAAFGHAARGSVPMNEIEFGEPRADALYQPHRLADLAAFYRAYGLDIPPDAGERQDHLCVELEFMSVLAAKEAFAMKGNTDADALVACRESQVGFLREHLGRWAPAFARMLITQVGPGVPAAFASLLRSFIEVDCARFGVAAGAEHLVVRPADETAERLCDGCGLQNLPPGAVAEA